MNLSQLSFAIICLTIGYYFHSKKDPLPIVDEKQIIEDPVEIPTAIAKKKSTLKNKTSHKPEAAQKSSADCKKPAKVKVKSETDPKLDSFLQPKNSSASVISQKKKSSAQENSKVKGVPIKERQLSQSSNKGKDSTSILGRSKLATLNEFKESKIVANYNNKVDKELTGFLSENSLEPQMLESSEDWNHINKKSSSFKSSSKNKALEIKPTKYSHLNPDQNLDQPKVTNSSYNVLRIVPTVKKEIVKTKISIPTPTADEYDKKAAKNKRKAEKIKAEKQAIARLQEVRLAEHRKMLENSKIKDQISKQTKNLNRYNNVNSVTQNTTVFNDRLVWN
ncbi:hypothetical protein BB561_003891 [Smittium simulii]|uniref:Uncharacterized protein n=1 Tax=Smittium simulii TaxID=133385 RepID=A0A2T9YIZ6_9FUNG|nr:hypothetical protein BB561_003891 [Smittium simulii]